MPLTTKRWDDPVDPGDGLRILVSRYRPRGLRRSDETWDEWIPQLGPSPALHARFYGKAGIAIGWSTYQREYLREMRGQQAIITDLAARVARGERITLLCSTACVHESRCHRSLLRDLILADARANQQTIPT